MAKLIKGVNDLKTIRPDIAAQWHPYRNGNLKPEDVLYSSAKKVWWLLPYDDPITGKHFDFEWEATIANRTNGAGCPYIAGKNIWKGYNDFSTINPELTAQWHPYKNGDLKPEDVTASSNKKVWWILPYDDPITGKRFDFEWETTVANRTEGKECPYLSGNAVWKGYNDLATTHPELAKEWHYEKNGSLRPEDVTAGSNKKVWWLLSAEVDGMKHFDFEWMAIIANRVKGAGCPYLSGNALWRGFNDLATTHPKIAAQWDYNKNGKLTPEDVTAKSNIKVWWIIPYKNPKTGEDLTFEWQASIRSRTQKGKVWDLVIPIK